IQRIIIAYINPAKRCIGSESWIILTQFQKRGVELFPFQFVEEHRVLVEETDSVRSWFFLIAVDNRHTATKCLREHGERRMNRPRHCCIVSAIPTVLIMVTREVNLDCIGGICAINLRERTIEILCYTITCGNLLHHMKHVPGIGSIEANG